LDGFRPHAGLVEGLVGGFVRFPAARGCHAQKDRQQARCPWGQLGAN
jgi:hypothetical protein